MERDRVGEAVERGRRDDVLHEGTGVLARAVTGRGRAWSPAEEPGSWRVASEDGRQVGTVRPLAGRFEGRVERSPTGPTGPEGQLAHGPQVFDDAVAALEYVEANVAP